MTPDQTEALYGLMCASWRNPPTNPELIAWTLAFEDADADLMMLVAKQIIREDRPYMPRPGEILAVARSYDPTIPPSLEEATGYYLAGQWTTHPLVEQAARGVEWDRRHPEVADRARFQFRDLYRSAVAGAEADQRRIERQELHGTGTEFFALLAGDAPELGDGRG